MTVNIAELKNRLSYYLHQVRAGEQVIIRDRNLPVAMLVPLSTADTSAEELTLVAEGKLALPKERLNEETFWALGAAGPVKDAAQAAARRAVSKDREERDAGLLGR